MQGPNSLILLTFERTRRGWSKSELARRAQMNPATVGQIEAGRLRPYPTQVRKLADALGLPPDEANRLLEVGTQEGTQNERLTDVAELFSHVEPVMEILHFMGTDSSRAICQPIFEDAA